MHPGIVADTIAGIESAVGHMAQNAKTDLLTLKREFTVSIIIARCFQTGGGSTRSTRSIEWQHGSR